MRPRRVLVTGSRKWTDAEAVYQNLARERMTAAGLRLPGLVVIHGACTTGADAFADLWARRCRDCDVTVERFPANWKRYGRAAGPLRNQRLIEARPDIVLAFPLPDSRGTDDCIQRALAAHIPVVTVAGVAPR